MTKVQVMQNQHENTSLTTQNLLGFLYFLQQLSYQFEKFQSAQLSSIIKHKTIILDIISNKVESLEQQSSSQDHKNSNNNLFKQFERNYLLGFTEASFKIDQQVFNEISNYNSITFLSYILLIFIILMNNYLDIIKQLQQAIELCTKENVELREQIIMMEIQQQPDKNLRISNLQKKIISQQQQIYELKQSILTRTQMKKEHHCNEDDRFLIEQMKKKFKEKSEEVNRYEEQYQKARQILKQTQQKVLDLKEQINQQCQLNAQEQQKVTKMELLMKNARQQEFASLQYILEIERLNSQIKQLELEQKSQSRISH